MIDIIMLTNVDWNIAERTKQSLLQYARKDRVILQVEPNFIEMEDCTVPILDKRKMEIIKTKTSFNSVYILDDDDWLLNSLEPLKDGYNGAVYTVQYGNELLSSIDYKRPGIAFGYARCLFQREWLLEAVEKAEYYDINACFDIYLFFELVLRGIYEKRDEVILGIDTTPRTMYVNKFRRSYHEELKKIKSIYEELS